jgi:hypothetical protein
MISLQRGAAVQSTALLLGLVNGHDVVAWADGVIATSDAPHPALFDVSLTPPHDLSGLRVALQPLAGEGESPDLVREMLALAARDLATGRRSAADTVRVLAQMRRMVALPVGLDHELDALEDGHMLAQAGVEGTPAAAEARIRAWLEQFVAHSAARED